jgi:predicted TIM-barrel fold metal-dependent hydrolase
MQGGFADRIMFGSDQMAWPDLIGDTIEAVETAAFLSPGQKRAIYYDNAARFLRLSPDQIRADHKR